MNKQPGKTGDSEAEVWNAISAFEQILDAIPNDRVALETLYNAYEKIGDQAQSLAYLVRLGTVVAEEADGEAAVGVLEKLQPRAAASAEAQQAVAALKELAAKHAAKAEKKAAAPRKAKRRTVDITAELALAWDLLQAQEITQEDYNNIVADLTETSGRNVDSPVSVLHVLADRQFKNADRILVHLCKQSGLPTLSLASFEVEKNLFGVLPPEFMAQRGAIVFERMADDLLVAILNPYDVKLREAVAEASGKKCHFYIVNARDYDDVLRQIRENAAEKEKKK